MSPTPTRYRRILLKLSGEALMGPDAFGVNPQTLASTIEDVKEAYDLGVQIAIVVGGGNIFRGVSLGARGMQRSRADHIGMLATLMNALTLQDALINAGVDARVQSAIDVNRMCEPFSQSQAVRHLEAGRVVIFACGTGNPFFSTDTAAALRGAEIGADVVMKATKVDGVYSADPVKFPDARFDEEITFAQCVSDGLRVMDTAAFALCGEQDIDILVFNLSHKGAIARACRGLKEGTRVHR